MYLRSGNNTGLLLCFDEKLEPCFMAKDVLLELWQLAVPSHKEARLSIMHVAECV